ncbi:hypothetical protein L9F63_010409, partial [Diploptera punctata]
MRIQYADAYSAIIPLLYILKVCGLSPLVLKGQPGKRRLKVSIISVIYSIFVILFTVIVRLTGLMYIIKFTRFQIVINIALKLSLISHQIISTQLILLSFFTSCKFAKIVNSFLKFDLYFNGLPELCYKSIRIVGIHLMFGTIYYFIYIIIAIIPAQQHTNSSYIGYFMSIIDLGILLIVNIKVSTVILLLNQRFRHLNGLIVKLIEQCPDNCSKVFVPHLTEYLISYNNYRECARNDILVIRETHGHLCDICKIFNSLYSSQALLVIVISVVIQIIQSYIILLKLLHRTEYYFNGLNISLLVILGSMWYTFQVIALVTSGQYTAKEVSK